MSLGEKIVSKLFFLNFADVMSDKVEVKKIATHTTAHHKGAVEVFWEFPNRFSFVMHFNGYNC